MISGGAAGEYCYRFSAANACGTTEAEVTVFVVPEQEVDAQPDVEVQLCAPVTFDTCLTATVTGLPGSCISWADLSGNVLGTGAELCVTPPVGTSYYIASAPGLGCIGADTVTIVVDTLPPPPPAALPDTLKLCIGQDTVIDLSSYGYPYTWSDCDGQVIPVSGDSLIISGGDSRRVLLPLQRGQRLRHYGSGGNRIRCTGAGSRCTAGCGGSALRAGNVRHLPDGYGNGPSGQLHLVGGPGRQRAGHGR